MMDPQGPIGRADAKILLDALGVMLFIVVPTIAAMLVFALVRAELTSWMVAGASCLVPCWPGFLTL